MTTAFDVRGKVTVVTGASYGLGEVFAVGLAEEGSDLVLAARSTELLDGVAERCRALGSTVSVVRCDVSSEADVQQLVQTAVADHGRIDVLVNNAGVADLRGLGAEQFDTETFRQILEVDLVGAFMVAREVGCQMLEQGSGSIINICSIMASGANETGVIAYSAAKGGLRNMTLQLGCEWADRGVRVNSISPGFIVTEMTRPALEGLGLTEYIASRTPMRRVGEASELMGPLLFLASDASSYVTGLDLLVDGGTNAANGYYQVAPVHHGWGEKLGKPMIGTPWAGLAPLPERFDVARPGIPGLHYELPAGG